METSAISTWHDLLVATAGASAALAGLLFVALSINLVRIIQSADLTNRAAEALLLLAGALVVSILMLVPDVPPHSLGWPLLAVAVCIWAPPLRIHVLSLRRKTYHKRSIAIGRLILYQAATLPMLVAGLALATGRSSGMDWLAGGLTACMVAALAQAWVLLIEIVR